jgi:hypothetical protein
MIEEKYIGLGLALGGTFLIGSSFIITKKASVGYTVLCRPPEGECQVQW